MSLIGSLLAFVLIPLKAKPAAERPKEVENLAVMALADEVRRLTFSLNFWREKVYALMEENERLRKENRRLRQEETGRQLYACVQQQAQIAQHNPQQQAYQRYEQMAWGDCTCVPARAQAFSNENTHRQEG